MNCPAQRSFRSLSGGIRDLRSGRPSYRLAPLQIRQAPRPRKLSLGYHLSRLRRFLPTSLMGAVGTFWAGFSYALRLLPLFAQQPELLPQVDRTTRI